MMRPHRMYRCACSFKHNAPIAQGRSCAFPTPARWSWTYPASRLLHSEKVLSESTPLLGVGMDSAPFEPQPQTRTRLFRKSGASVLTGPPFLRSPLVRFPSLPSQEQRPPLPAVRVAVIAPACRKVPQGSLVWRGLGCPPSSGVLSGDLGSPVRGPGQMHRRRD